VHFPDYYQYISTATPGDLQVIVNVDLLVCLLVVHLMGDKYELLDQIFVPEPGSAISASCLSWSKRKLT